MLLRYPGGKSRGKLKDHIVCHIKNHYKGGTFAETFFGGGGITFNLLKEGIINNVVICEKDSALLALWKKVARDPDDLIDKVEDFVPSVQEFILAKSACLAGAGTPMDALVVNRLSHAGRGVKAGPQGGYDQTGKYKIGCRWNTLTIVRNIRKANKLMKGRCKFFKDYTSGLSANYLYFDPPYWEVGDGLYQHSFTKEQHFSLKEDLSERDNWLLSYNNCPEIKELYKDYNIEVFGTAGNGGDKPGTELLIYP